MSLFQATVEATEEAILNALLQATTVTGRDGRDDLRPFLLKSFVPFWQPIRPSND